MADALPPSCPRCEIGSKRLGSDWCCWELKKLQQLMAQPVPPTMGEVLRVHFIGRSAASIDRACRRYGLKIPLREREPRRKRCADCGFLIARGATQCDCGMRSAA